MAGSMAQWWIQHTSDALLYLISSHLASQMIPLIWQTVTLQKPLLTNHGFELAPPTMTHLLTPQDNDYMLAYGTFTVNETNSLFFNP